MTSNDLHRAVARATGESVATVKRIGFMLTELDDAFPDAETEDVGPAVFDWDELEPASFADFGWADPSLDDEFELLDDFDCEFDHAPMLL